ncbi:Alpha/beta hydrolase fold-1 [Exophiala viscosa]|uniref:Alpha/beta hydrolase fold-1 n=1 Tax=Exophiala viscosa TaxID=2486360 RepID=UPI00219BF6F3|nr:Alpha/beta hydrolase fold-1 [Exophiala viscosa]
MNTKPVIYMLHGAWHSPAYFVTVKSMFEARGYKVISPQVPTSGAVPPTKTLYDDADFVRGELEPLIEHGQDVVLVMHSYGGVVGTQAAAGLGKAERQNRGLKGGIVHLFYACSFIVALGQSLCDPLGGKLAPWIKAEDDGSCNPMDPEQLFYQDLPADQQKYWAAQLKHHVAQSQLDPVNRVAYKNIPVSYLYCENDQALPLQFQKLMVKQCGVEVKEYTCDAGHSPFLSQPDMFVDCIVQAAESTT